MLKSIGAFVFGRCRVGGRFWEGPLWEAPLYIIIIDVCKSFFCENQGFTLQSIETLFKSVTVCITDL